MAGTHSGRNVDFGNGKMAEPTMLVDSNGDYVAAGAGTAQGAVTNRSGTLTAGGTAQQVMATNVARRYLLVQNVSAGDLWLNFGSTAVQAQPSVKLPPDAALVMEAGFVSTELVSIIGATTGQAFVAKEG